MANEKGDDRAKNQTTPPCPKRRLSPVDPRERYRRMSAGAGAAPMLLRAKKVAIFDLNYLSTLKAPQEWPKGSVSGTLNNTDLYPTTLPSDYVSMAPSSTTGFLTVSENPLISIFFEVSTTLPIPAGKPTIVLSNSLSAATWLWDQFAASFSKSYTIVRYDMRFHGQSPLSNTPGFDYEAGHTVEDLASDVIRLLDHLEIKQAEAFIGLSIGGSIGVVLAAHHPDRFRRLLIVGSRAHATFEDDKIWDQRIALAREEGTAALAKQSVARWFKEEWRTAHPELVASITARFCSWLERKMRRL
ncbi:uncharacterized protein NECHADRAFT_86541 [Fusarium vanettenii 77-13-4]|uniref:AB hydrolase-1 domain-containing protein n=1 Tax=Fusarium vanettenii (strain ATCC MYA-4622 / CBS 123669 / FGSC 9596 / NRRL 45880 / 77-13-4) TaxID=660122 RepID=C7ZHA5_FUSV7|nr:uncharacterized protein NECHADRAFT_86541 [Fusarium vanettenii 77-13-4]EEU36631.1 hypothetical protein NECHADRAFT_86541 [Fusarium vanettenii 77-13-4]